MWTTGKYCSFTTYMIYACTRTSRHGRRYPGIAGPEHIESSSNAHACYEYTHYLPLGPESQFFLLKPKELVEPFWLSFLYKSLNIPQNVLRWQKLSCHCFYPFPQPDTAMGMSQSRFKCRMGPQITIGISEEGHQPQPHRTAVTAANSNIRKV